MIKYLAKISIILIFSQLLGCEKIKNMDEKYDWLTLTVADMGYPMEIRNGSFYNEKGEDIAGIPADMYLSSQWWNGDSGVVIAGEQYRDIPASMKIKWFSYAEDKFYEGDFKLDYEKISAHFKKGLKCEDGTGNYKYIKVAIAPGGQVFLYLIGGNNVCIGSYLAKEVFVSDFKEEMGYTVDETRDQFLVDFIAKMQQQTQKEIAEHKINTTIWNDINKKYPWKYTLEVAVTETKSRNPFCPLPRFRESLQPI